MTPDLGKLLFTGEVWCFSLAKPHASPIKGSFVRMALFFVSQQPWYIVLSGTTNVTMQLCTFKNPHNVAMLPTPFWSHMPPPDITRRQWRRLASLSSWWEHVSLHSSVACYVDTELKKHKLICLCSPIIGTSTWQCNQTWCISTFPWWDNRLLWTL